MNSVNYSKCHFDFATLPWLTSPRKQLDLKGVALGLINLPPGTFTVKARALFRAPDRKIINLNTQAFDAFKHGGLPLVADAKAGLAALDKGLGAWSAPGASSETSGAPAASATSSTRPLGSRSIPWISGRK